MAGVRRSGRIPKEIPIVLLGTDTSGRVFSEHTRTLVLSRHGAGILSRNKFSPDETLTMRIADSGRETEIRLVGHLGEDPRGYVYGVTFSDPGIDFWQIEFPSPHDLTPPTVELECCFCNQRSFVRQTEIESDVYLASQSVLRYCQICGQTTTWKHATSRAPAAPRKPAPLPAPMRESPPPSPFVASASLPTLAPQSAYASTALLDEIVTGGFTPSPEAAPAVAAPPAASLPAFSGGGKPNRRRHVRTRVNFTACVRHSASDEEIVECDNISKGGFCFRSRKHYEENSVIEVAVPFSPGQQAFFVPARIRRVEELPGLGLFRYGAAYE